MKSINGYDKFMAEDVRQVIKELTKWALLHSNAAVLLFNIKTIYRIYNAAIDQGIENIQFAENQIKIDDIIIEWYELAGSKCMLKNLTSTSRKTSLYREPDSWKNTTIWEET